MRVKLTGREVARKWCWKARKPGLVLLVVVLWPAAALAATTELVSVSNTGEVVTGYPASSSISQDGRFVCFLSDAANLASVDTGGHQQAYVRDRTAGTTELVSVYDSGEPGDLAVANGTVKVSADGRYAVFASYATSPLPWVSMGVTQVYVRDRIAGTTEMISQGLSGEEGNGYCEWWDISADGRFVAFSSFATNLVPGIPQGGGCHVYVRDRSTGKTELVSLSSTGALENAAATHGDQRRRAVCSLRRRPTWPRGLAGLLRDAHRTTTRMDLPGSRGAVGRWNDVYQCGWSVYCL